MYGTQHALLSLRAIGVAPIDPGHSGKAVAYRRSDSEFRLLAISCERRDRVPKALVGAAGLQLVGGLELGDELEERRPEA